MKISMLLDRRTYAGSPVDIVRKLRADAIHMKTRDIDAYVRTVVTRLRAEQQADIDLEGSSLEERCESFLAGVIRSGMAIPVFQRDHLDAAAIRVLRRARRLTQERLAALLRVSFATVNRWEAGEHLPSNTAAIEQELFVYFTSPPAHDDDARSVASATPASRHAGVLELCRERVRQRFRAASQRLASPASRHL
jgi:transcriptional regulator with XRE-family HTH domain